MRTLVQSFGPNSSSSNPVGDAISAIQGPLDGLLGGGGIKWKEFDDIYGKEKHTEM